MNYTKFHKIPPTERWEKWARVFFVCIFVASYNFETTTRACVSEARLRHPLSKFWQHGKLFWALMTYLKGILEILGHKFGDKIQKKENLPYGWLSHWKWATVAAKIRPVRVTRGGWCCARLTRRFFKACAIARFRNQFAHGQKTIGSHLKLLLLSHSLHHPKANNSVSNGQDLRYVFSVILNSIEMAAWSVLMAGIWWAPAGMISFVVTPSAQKKMNEKFPELQVSWKEIYSLPFVVTIETKKENFSIKY